MEAVYEKFLNPGSEFSPMPFWFWNDRLDKKILRAQIEDFQEKGVEGFVLHPRMGIPKETEYLSDKFMDFVKFAVEEAHQRKMHVILYDEAMYPSGAANGKVVKKNPKFASRGLFATKIDELPDVIEIPFNDEDDRLVAVYLAEKGKENNTVNAERISCIFPLNAQIIRMTDKKASILQEEIDRFFEVKDRQKEEYCCIILKESYTNGTIRGVHAEQDDGEKNAPRSADLLNPEAVRTFIELTHERYREVVGQYFGNTIFAMFTDEPDITGRNADPGCIAWTGHFERFIYQAGLHVEDLPGLFFHIGEKTAHIRQTYQKVINKRMRETYYIPIAEWCQANQLYLTGHPAKSDDIGLLEPFTLPGQDVVWRWVAPEDEKGVTGEHSTAGKCGADAARHYQRQRNLNEYLGVCGIDNSWNLSASDMKWYTDWLAVRGVNLFCPHAFYYSVNGKVRSHERPPDVGPNNVWWPHYNHFSTYIKRLSWLMTDSINQAEIGVLALNNYLPWKTAKYFYQNQIEFNYLHEALFVDGQLQLKDNCIIAGDQSYRILVIDEIEISEFDQVVKQLLTEFIKNDGKVYIISSNREMEELEGVTYLPPDDMSSFKKHFLASRYAELTGESSNIRLTKLKKSGKIYYFFTNEGETNYKGTVKFFNDMPSEEWNPWAGSRKRLVQNDNGQYFLHLPYRESIIWSVEASENLKNDDRPGSAKLIEIDPILQPSNLSKHEWSRDSLVDWSMCEEYQYYSGTITYHFSFNYHGEKVDEVMVDLGDVYEIAEVSLNQGESEVKMWSPYMLQFPGEKLIEGENALTVRITNNSANQMDKQSLPSGLIGPVKVIGSVHSN
ncbi:hypothetical protein SAMN04487944_10489 [Gracilibacillus ureilyticus]|uniref:Alpha-L-rhamnosidase n=1 Tax=Gracilibacillus ureilyticus TaxID=531814 RepID=A0A1H9P3Y6_9BACI|nr:hypothetical protein [Gracilibacillus ureilyticus]SER42888.1 hypothetical protein SAMN04487944_10489 [Gracilibacillus ureilyticus]